MILPLGDAPNPRGLPLVTYLLLFANVAVYLVISLPLSSTGVSPHDPNLQPYIDLVIGQLPAEYAQTYLAQLTAYDLFIFEHGFRAAAPSLPGLFNSLFLHAGLAHLAGNMLFLWIYGDNVEHRLGAPAYLLAYLGTGIVATLSHAVFDLDSHMPLIGASGAISGVLGFYFVWFPHNRVRLFVFLFPFLMETIYVRASLVLGLYLIADNLLPLLLTGFSGSGIAYSAHIGGFLAGLVLARVLDRRELVATPRGMKRVDRKEDSAKAVIDAALDRGDFERASAAYFALPPKETHRVLGPADSLALASWLQREGHPHAALAVYRRHIRDYPTGPGLPQAHLGAGLIQRDALRRPIPAYQHFLDVLQTNPSPAVAHEARQALAEIDRQQKLRRLDDPTKHWWDR